jgi:hypothetical protein
MPKRVDRRHAMKIAIMKPTISSVKYDGSGKMPSGEVSQGYMSGRRAGGGVPGSAVSGCFFSKMISSASRPTPTEMAMSATLKFGQWKSP